ncbi:MAG TPA: methyltransferase domain-containing protein [Pyrinomonadaceae bacterium]|nr:methyltransferase domain-containing protein [Pyrinomonadaceae bacterium]
MKTALVYRSIKLYELAMLLLYGRHYFTRYRVLADLIPPQTSVLDLCCGPGILYQRYLRQKGVSYTGLDINERFVKRVNQMDGKGLIWDLRDEKPLPRADYVVMQASLYHFLPDPTRIAERMLSAAAKRVIIAEPIRNLSGHNTRFLRNLAKRFSDTGTGEQMRFTEQSLDNFLARYSSKKLQTFLIPGGREKVYVLDVTP